MEVNPRSYSLFFSIIFLLCSCAQNSFSWEKRQVFTDEFIKSIHIDSMESLPPIVTVSEVDRGIVKVNVKFALPDSLKLDDWQVIITPNFEPDFHWAPHLTPTDSNIIAQHVFRSPAIIMASSSRQVTIIPDLDLIPNDSVHWYMDMNAISNTITLGASHAKVSSHVLFERQKGQVIPPGIFEFGFYIITESDQAALANPWRRAASFLWKKWGTPLFKMGEPIAGSLEPYVRHTYNWAFKSWKNAVWQEFNLAGKTVGAPVFIVNITQSPNYPGDVNEREFRSIWNQAWFSSLRSAQGLYRYARRTNDTALMRKAVLTKELALSFPQHNGLFNSVIATPMERIEKNGKELNRSTGWTNYFFGNSNRNPAAAWQNASLAPLHILDMSWTALLMLGWYEELEKDDRLLQYALRYADRLLTLQDVDGFFPGWLDSKTNKPLGVLDQSPESAMSVSFLLKLAELTNQEKYKTAALKAMDAILIRVVPAGQWEDFETYWSCSRILDSLINKKVSRNNQYKQNTLSIYWTAEALFNAYKSTGQKNYLKSGQRVLDELLMYQACWQPPYIAVRALGGFGVMNGDGEWNDSRQSLFAELIIRYGRELNIEEYVQRGIAALKASFVMMYCPENPATMEQWQKVYPFFNQKDYGFMMENYGHGGQTDNQGLGIGEFTIYDWGNGAAAEAYNRIKDRHGALLR